LSATVIVANNAPPLRRMCETELGDVIRLHAVDALAVQVMSPAVA
jgi:hypothetical protein